MNSSADDAAPKAKRKLFYGLFIFPVLLAVGMAILLCGVVFLTNEKETPETLVASIKSGIKGKRWQKAFELSNELNLRPETATDEILKEILYIFDPANGYDSKTRSYMALALGRFKQPGAVHILEKALQEDNADIQLYSLWSLGNLQNRSSANSIEPLLSHDNDELRKTAAYVLGALGNPDSIPALQQKLHDHSIDVRWNAALALARLNNSSGDSVLISMLDRRALEAELKLNEKQIETTMINAMKGLVLIRNAQSVTILQTIAREDVNLKVRQAAIEAIHNLK